MVGGGKWLFTNWDTQDETGPESLPQGSQSLVWSQKQDSLPLVNSLLWLGREGKGPWWGVGGNHHACFWLEKALPDLQEGNSSASALPTSKGGRLYSPRGHWTPSPPSSIGGDKLVSLDLRTESATFSRSPVQRTEKKLSGWCSPKLEKSMYYRVNIYHVLFDVGFYPFFF